MLSIEAFFIESLGLVPDAQPIPTLVIFNVRETEEQRRMSQRGRRINKLGNQTGFSRVTIGAGFSPDQQIDRIRLSHKLPSHHRIVRCDLTFDTKGVCSR